MGVEFCSHAVGESIGGIDEDEVEAGRVGRPAASRQPAPGVGADQLGAVRRARGARRCRAPAGCRGRPAWRARRRARAPRSPARRCRSRGRAPGAAVDVPERREDRLADAVGGRPHLPAARRDQLRPFSSPAITRIGAGHCRRAPCSHRFTGNARLGCRLLKRDRVGGAGAEAAAGGVEQGAEGRGLERAVAASSARTSSRAAIRSGVVLGQAGDGEARQAVLAGAEDLALAAQAEVDLGELEAVAARARPPARRRRAIPPARSAKSRHWDGCSPRPTRPRSWWSWETP